MKWKTQGRWPGCTEKAYQSATSGNSSESWSKSTIVTPLLSKCSLNRTFVTETTAKTELRLSTLARLPLIKLIANSPTRPWICIRTSRGHPWLTIFARCSIRECFEACIPRTHRYRPPNVARGIIWPFQNILPPRTNRWCQCHLLRQWGKRSRKPRFSLEGYKSDAILIKRSLPIRFKRSIPVAHPTNRRWTEWLASRLHLQSSMSQALTANQLPFKSGTKTKVS